MVLPSQVKCPAAASGARWYRQMVLRESMRRFELCARELENFTTSPVGRLRHSRSYNRPQRLSQKYWVSGPTSEDIETSCVGHKQSGSII
ncbi:hypothetical protein RRG08_021932 [Elysia crispata]|uniref:Uncharacterized protein n=1 Tax=Elysia crispata TaxID=231223 RepID=A0AAE1DWC3_9GAST|nr:hypothetical protein RRG08_021932 [Elysia crispata]